MNSGNRLCITFTTPVRQPIEESCRQFLYNFGAPRIKKNTIKDKGEYVRLISKSGEA